MTKRKVFFFFQKYDSNNVKKWNDLKTNKPLIIETLNIPQRKNPYGS